MDATPLGSSVDESPEAPLAWAAAWRIALVAALVWTTAALLVGRLGRVTPLVLLGSTVLAGLAVGVRLPALAPSRGSAPSV